MRYLTGRLADSTVILLTGRSIRFIDQAAALARRLQPSMVVLEDVDLVATDRDYTPDGNPPAISRSAGSRQLTSGRWRIFRFPLGRYGELLTLQGLPARAVRAS